MPAVVTCTICGNTNGQCSHLLSVVPGQTVVTANGQTIGTVAHWEPSQSRPVEQIRSVDGAIIDSIPGRLEPIQLELQSSTSRSISTFFEQWQRAAASEANMPADSPYQGYVGVASFTGATATVKSLQDMLKDNNCCPYIINMSKPGTIFIKIKKFRVSLKAVKSKINPHMPIGVHLVYEKMSFKECMMRLIHRYKVYYKLYKRSRRPTYNKFDWITS
jgi:hypothetical protein